MNTQDSLFLGLLFAASLLLPLLTYGAAFASGYFWAKQRGPLGLGLGALALLAWCLPLGFTLVFALGHYFHLPGLRP